MEDFLCIYLFFSLLTWMMRSYFLTLVDMNYLIIISVDSTIKANCRMLCFLLQKRLFLLLSFSIFKKNKWFLKNNKFIPRTSFRRGKESNPWHVMGYWPLYQNSPPHPLPPPKKKNPGNPPPPQLPPLQS